MQEMMVQSLVLEDLLEKEMATHHSILAWEMDRGVWQATVHGVAKSWILCHLSPSDLGTRQQQ